MNVAGNNKEIPGTSTKVENAVDFLMKFFPVDPEASGAQDLDENNVSPSEIELDVNFHYDIHSLFNNINM